MKTPFVPKATAAAAVLLALSGCVASNPVYHVNNDQLPEDLRGALFALPKTRLTLGYTRKTVTFEKGEHTDIVERCLDPTQAPKTFCERTEYLDIKSLRPSLKDKTCAGDAKESRVSFGTFTLTPSQTPDPDEIYAVELRRNYFQNFDMDLEMDAFGVIGRGQASTTERAAEDALRLLTSLGSGALGVGESGLEGTYESSTKSIADKSAKPDPWLKAATADLQRLESLIATRDKLVATVDANGLARSSVVVARLGIQIDALRGKFTGLRETEQDDSATSAFVPDKLKMQATVLEFSLCGEENNSHKLVLNVEKVSDTHSLADSLGKLAQSDAKSAGVYWSQRLNGKDKKVGWPYRLPVLAVVKAGTCEISRAKNGEEESCDPKKLKFIAETGIAQFGKVLRLPAGTGGRTSNIAATYSSLGSITKLAIDQDGQDATPLFDTATAVLNKPPKTPPPGEAVVLQEEIALITARQSLCKLIYGVTEPRCVSANPPVE